MYVYICIHMYYLMLSSEDAVGNPYNSCNVYYLIVSGNVVSAMSGYYMYRIDIGMMLTSYALVSTTDCALSINSSLSLSLSLSLSHP